MEKGMSIDESIAHHHLASASWPAAPASVCSLAAPACLLARI
jgi:hypothetical protein